MNKFDAEAELEEANLRLDKLEQKLTQLENAVVVKDPYSHGFIGGGVEDQLQRVNVGEAVFALLKHFRLYPKTIVRKNEITLEHWEQKKENR